MVITDQYDHGYSLVRTYGGFLPQSCVVAGFRVPAMPNTARRIRNITDGTTALVNALGLYGVQSVACAVGVPITPDLTAADIPRGLILTNAVSVDPRLSVLSRLTISAASRWQCSRDVGDSLSVWLQDGDAGADPTACTGAYAQGRVLKIVWLAQDGTRLRGSLTRWEHCRLVSLRRLCH